MIPDAPKQPRTKFNEWTKGLRLFCERLTELDRRQNGDRSTDSPIHTAYLRSIQAYAAGCACQFASAGEFLQAIATDENQPNDIRDTAWKLQSARHDILEALP